ncbi:DUF563 domain-containing protein [Limnothrix sp. FACHB-708]|uniref:glycosyltransferase family 61 protein n=1 Tax=unclassified Limnothrix TaxID=2632864 RepID=UPI00168280AD|nr:MULTISPECIES: glycosyltransferase family 61 protein [unclassified Limnothrix]MBD2554138.1 DUF563 domain-containing protein [Limnothrix sp. FACHB-708]MBD2591020.1 DUF563 domain-containing protein [Limnothrix sp. FACHB-406]
MKISSLGEKIAQAKALTDQEQVFAIVSHYCQKLDACPEWLDGYNFLAKILTEQEAVPEAITVYQQAIQVFPEQATLYVNLATLLLTQSHFAAALRAYEQAILLDPNWHHSYLCLARLHKYLAQLEDAVATCDRGLKVSPGAGDLWQLRSQCLEQQGRWEAAIEGYLHLLAINPGSDVAYQAIKRLGVDHQRQDWFDFCSQHDLTPSLLHRFSQIISCDDSLVWSTALPQNSSNQDDGALTLNPQLGDCFELKAAMVWIESQAVAILNHEKKFLVEACSGKLSTLIWEKFAPDWPEVQPGKALILSTLCGENYYHWMFDILPRIGRYKEKFYQDKNALDKIDYFVFDKINHPFHKESLSLLGIETSKVIETGNQAVLCFESVLVPSYMNGITRYACNFLRNTFLSRALQPQELTAITGSVELQATDAQPTENHLARETSSLSIHPLGADKSAKKIYITRSKASYRRLLNETEVMEFLIAEGFEIVELETLPLLKQVAMFATAEVVVAPHGAGLTNLVFASPGTWVLELLSIAYRPVCYKVISEFVDLNYRYVIGEAIQRADGLFQEEPAWYDLRIDLEKIKAILAEFSSSPS